MDIQDYRLPPARRCLRRCRRAFTRPFGRMADGGRRLARRMIAGFRRVRGTVAAYFADFGRGDALTRSSYAVMGLGHLFRGQVVRGLLYLASQVAFFAYMVGFGARQFVLCFEHFFSGGSIGRVQTSVAPIWDEQLGQYVTQTGDDSFRILLFGLLTLFVILTYLACYFSSVRESVALEGMRAIGRRPSGFLQDLDALTDRRFHLTLLSLPLLGLFVFTVIPLLTMILVAFTNYDADHTVPKFLVDWVGLSNFRGLFSGASELGATFRRVLGWTLVWALFATFTNYFFGMLLALLINKKGIRLKKLYRTLFVATIAVPQFVSLLIMSKMLDTGGGLPGSGGGIITQAVESLFGYHLRFGLDINTTRIAIIAVNLWIGLPYTMLMCSGILMNIPGDLYESARIDGASPARRFFKITLPYMLFVTGPYLITQFIGNINNFNVIYLLSGGGPGDNLLYSNGAMGTDLLITWLYKLTLTDNNYKLAAVIGIIVFVISAAFSLIVYRRSSAVMGEETFQ